MSDQRPGRDLSRAAVEALMVPGEDIPIDLTDIVERPAWMLDGLCREHPEIVWVPDPDEDVTAAEEVCAACLVHDECLAWVLDQPDAASIYGVWAGTSRTERLALLEDRPEPRQELRDADAA